MSWIWNSPPPTEEPANPTSAEQFPSDPYFSSSSDPYTSTDPFIASDPYTSTPSSDSFGTAFSDDIDITPPSSSDSFHTSPAFPSTPQPFDLPPPSSSSSSPSIDFKSMGRINPSIVSPRAALRTPDLSPSVDYVFSDDYKEIRKKSGAEQLTYLAGSSYLTGAVVGGSRGFYEAMRASSGKPTKLRLNAILNGAGKRGSLMANTFGVLALTFSLSESALYNYTSDETLSNYALAGATAGALYKSTHGPRTALIWAVGGAAVALSSVYASRQGYYGKGLQGVL